MLVAMKDFTVHLGSHDYGIEGLKKIPRPQGHKLSEPQEGVLGLELPFMIFAAKDLEAADIFVRRVNYLAAKYGMDPLDLSCLVHVVDRLSGR